MSELPESLYVVRKVGGECLFSHQFDTASYDASLVSAFLGVINQLGDQVLGRESNLSVIDQGNTIIVLEHGKEVFIAAKARMERTLRSKLNSLVNSFEQQFSEDLQNWVGNLGQFERFRLKLFEVFPLSKVSPNAVPVIAGPVPLSLPEDLKVTYDSILGEITKFIDHIDGVKNLSTITDELNFSFESIQSFSSLLHSLHIIKFQELRQNNIDIKPTQTGKLVKAVLEEVPTFTGDMNRFSVPEQNFLKLCDGTRTLRDIASKLDMPYFDALRFAVQLKKQGMKMVRRLITKK